MFRGIPPGRGRPRAAAGWRAIAGVVAVMLSGGCRQWVPVRPTSILVLERLVDEPSVQLSGPDGPLEVDARTPLRLELDDGEGLEIRPSELGFQGEGVFSIGRGGRVVNYTEVRSLEVRVRDSAGNAAWIVPVVIGGVVLLVGVVYAVYSVAGALAGWDPT